MERLLSHFDNPIIDAFVRKCKCFLSFFQEKMKRKAGLWRKWEEKVIFAFGIDFLWEETCFRGVFSCFGKGRCGFVVCEKTPAEKRACLWKTLWKLCKTPYLRGFVRTASLLQPVGNPQKTLFSKTAVLPAQRHSFPKAEKTICQFTSGLFQRDRFVRAFAFVKKVRGFLT